MKRAWRNRFGSGDLTDAEYIEKLRSKTIPTEAGCWKWQGPLSKPPLLPYGKMSYQGKVWPAHRLSYALLKGPIPEGHEVLHKCDNAWCVNPAHLETGTHDDNVKDCARKGRIFWAQKTHCPKGHEYTPENIVAHKGRVNPRRHCRECIRIKGYLRHHGLPPGSPVPPRMIPIKRRGAGQTGG